MRIYKIPHSMQFISITEKVMKKLFRFRQSKNRNERGGILFARIKLPEICISKISLPQKYDNNSKYSYNPNQYHQQLLINRYFKLGYHFVGEWHTHPEAIPVPSGIDLASMKESFLKSHHELNYFILIIVGNEKDNESLWLSLHDKNSVVKLILS